MFLFCSAAKIGVFYLIFYGMLAALVAICMWVFFQTLDPRIPKWQLDRSIIGTNPGLGFRPQADNVESTLIWFQAANKTNYLKWVNNLKGFLESTNLPSKCSLVLWHTLNVTAWMSLNFFLPHTFNCSVSLICLIFTYLASPICPILAHFIWHISSTFKWFMVNICLASLLHPTSIYLV